MSGETEIHERIAHLVSRDWPIERLLALYQDRMDGKPTAEIAERLGLTLSGLLAASQRLFNAGVLGRRLSGWTSDGEEGFRTLWEEGHSIGEISRRLGITKSAGVGKSHRMIAKGLLAARPRLPGNLTPEAIERRRARAQTAEEAQQKRNAHQREVRRLRAEREARTPKTRAPKRLTPVALNRPLVAQSHPPVAAPKSAAPYVPPPKYGRIVECCWPIGEPGTSSLRFCDKPTDPGRPYCHTHVGKAYAKAPTAAERRAEA